jgi:biotin synthase-related radical SAM superfamily protein
MAGVVPPSTAMALVANMSEKRKSTPPSAVLVKNQWKTISTEEKLDIINWPEKSEQFCVMSHTLDLLIAA